MDFDIDDILASVDKPLAASPSSTALDHQLLTRLWIAERSAPEVLPWPAAIMDRITNRLGTQITKIEDLASGILPLEQHAAGGVTNQNLNLTIAILQTDLSRTQFVVRSLLRQRLAKLTKHSMHYLTLLQSPNSPDTKTQLLSPAETTFLQSHQALLGNFYGASFLNAFPAQLQKLDDNAGGMSMVEGPDEKAAVFVRCSVDRWDAQDLEEKDNEASSGSELKMERGQVWVVRWEHVRSGIRDGSLEML